MEFEIPWDALFGGMLLGLSASLLLLLNGRIAGISGIVSGLLKPENGEVLWRVLFVIGMVFSALLAPKLGFELPPQSLPVSSFFWVGVAGLLVGIGTKIGNGVHQRTRHLWNGGAFVRTLDCCHMRVYGRGCCNRVCPFAFALIHLYSEIDNEKLVTGSRLTVNSTRVRNLVWFGGDDDFGVWSTLTGLLVF